MGPRADRRRDAGSSSGRWRRGGSGRTRSRRRSRRCTPRRPTPAATDWAEIVGLYDVLLRTDPSPVVELNRAVAVAMRDGPAAGLALVDAHPRRAAICWTTGFAHAARADLCRRLGRTAEARAVLRAGALAHAAGARAPVPRAAPRGARTASAAHRQRRADEVSVPRVSGRTRSCTPSPTRSASPAATVSGNGGMLVAAEALQPRTRRQRSACETAERVDHRRSVRGNEGAAGGLLPGRGRRPERGDPDRRQNPAGTRRQRRGAAGPRIGSRRARGRRAAPGSSV